MTDEKHENGHKKPPKDKLTNGNGHSNGEPESEGLTKGPNRPPEDTPRIDVGKARPAAAAEPRTPSFAETQPISAEEVKKKDTYRIQLDAAREPQDTEPVPPDEAPTSGVSILTPKDRDAILKKSTMRVDLDPEITAPEEEVEPQKSKTARIDVPEETVSASGGRPKTIKIKRAERPSTLTSAPRVPMHRKTLASADDVGKIGTVYIVAAVIAVVITGVLLYVLAAQTVAPDLPFVGKL